MRDTGNVFAPRLVACVLVVAVHGMLGWLLWRASRLPVSRDGDAAAFEVVYVSRPPRRAPDTGTRPASLPSTQQRRTARHLTLVHGAANAPAITANPDAPLQAQVTTSAVFLQQARDLASARSQPVFAPDPLRRRDDTFPRTAPERFRMRRALEPSGVLAAIGTLVGGPGYRSDPCPQIRRNIAGRLAFGRDDALLQAERERERLCD